ncbi:MAG: chromosomal replication initiator protein DnaA [Muribaculaceae bacterium]|nr:chromosomal replication initiator protein DnaA [Muribaculaceae bacterium]
MDISEVNVLWNKVKEELEINVPEHVFQTWISPLEATDFENNTLVILSPHQMAVDVLKKGWMDNIKTAVKKVLGEDAVFSLTFDADFASRYIKARKKELSKQVAGQSEEEKKTEETKLSLAQMQSEANLNLNLKFENFVVGENSKFAYNAAFSVANNPSKKFNPLFIYGSSGLGKTHLMQAIGHYIIFNKPNLKVRYIRMEEYFNEWVKCFQYNDNPNAKRKSGCNNTLMRKFHQKFQNVDILLMDDIQFIESKMKTMEDFFSTFEALYTNNKQIVIASDRLPKDIPTLDNRLRTRFEMGLVVDIVPPDFETRFEIVKAYAKELEVEAEDEVFEYIASNFANNVRELKGAFNKVSAYAEFSDVGVTLSLAQKALNCEIRKKDITVEKIAKATADYFDLTVKDLKSTARQQKIAHARHLAVYLSREILSMSYEAIGEYFVKKHTTIMYSCDIIEDKIKSDKTIAAEIEELTSIIKN